MWSCELAYVDKAEPLVPMIVGAIARFEIRGKALFIYLREVCR
jgi:hypothetical protein